MFCHYFMKDNFTDLFIFGLLPLCRRMRTFSGGGKQALRPRCGVQAPGPAGSQAPKPLRGHVRQVRASAAWGARLRKETVGLRRRSRGEGRHQAPPARGSCTPPGVLSGLRLLEAALVMLVPAASPSLWPLPSQHLCLLPTHRETFKAAMSQLRPPFTARQAEAEEEGFPKVAWRRGLGPRPPSQLAPCLTWQLAAPSHLRSGLSPLSFPKGAAPHASVRSES